MFTIEFEKISLTPFLELPEAVRSEAFFRSNEFTNAYVNARARDVVERMGAVPEIAPERVGAWEWLQRKLQRAAESDSLASEPSGELRTLILEEVPALVSTLDLIDLAAEGYPDFLRGRRDGSAVLFDPARPALWEEYFSNQNPVYAAGNTLASFAASEAFAAEPPGRTLRVLEVGAGCGSAAEALLDALAPRIASYLMTDISPGFLRRAQRRLSRHLAVAEVGLDVKLLDINRPPHSWPIAAERFDLVCAVNVLHAARDLVASLGALRELLAEGGRVVLGECVRPARGHPLHPEFIFQLLHDPCGVVLDPEMRPEPGFLDREGWGNALARAGFSRVRFLPDLEAAVAAYPEHSLAAIVARP